MEQFPALASPPTESVKDKNAKAFRFKEFAVTNMETHLPWSYKFHFQIYPPIIHSNLFITGTPNLPTFSWFLAISMLLMTFGAANRFKLRSQKQKTETL